MSDQSRSNREWVAALPAELARQRHALAELLDHCENTPEITSFSVGCSIGRGAADALSDIDAAIGVRAPRGVAGADVVRRVEAATVGMLPRIGPLVDVLRQETTAGELFIRTVFAQYDDRLQLDLAVIAESEVRRGEAAPDFVGLYQRPDPAGTTVPSAREVTDSQLREWIFHGWRALLDADKYLRRGSLWEAHQRLHETRDCIWKLWAAAQGALYPWHGLSQVLDHDPARLPDRIEETVAGIDADALRHALAAAADVLDDVTLHAQRAATTALSVPMAAYARRTLRSSDERLIR